MTTGGEEPARIGRFRVLRRLGAGGMGVVYEGVDELLDRRAAIKVIREETAQDPEGRQRFLREARAAAAVSHPHVATIYEVGEDGDRLYLAMEYVEGATLRAELAAGPLPLGRAVTLAREIASALGAAHAAGLVHRDLKPDNVMIDARTGAAKVLDFGLAKRVETAPISGTEETLAPELTQEGLVMGSPGYMSPEQLQGKRIDARTDVWAFGVLLYELLAGRRPFHGDSAVAMVLAVCTEPPPPLAREDVPPGLVALVLCCLAKAAADRPADGGALVDALDALDAPDAPPDAPSAVRAVTSTPVAKGLVPARRSRTVGIVAALIAALAATAAAGAYLLRDRHEPARTGPKWGPAAEAPAAAPDAAVATGPADPRHGPAVIEDAHPRPCLATPEVPCGAGAIAWCHPEGRRVACCGAGLVPTDDGLCECPPGGADHEAAIAGGCPAGDLPAGVLRERVRAAVQAIVPGLRACLEEIDGPEVRGRILGHFFVSPWGEVWDVRIDASDVPSPAHQRCYLAALSTIRIEPPLPGSVGVAVNYPISVR